MAKKCTERTTTEYALTIGGERTSRTTSIEEAIQWMRDYNSARVSGPYAGIAEKGCDGKWRKFA